MNNLFIKVGVLLVIVFSISCNNQVQNVTTDTKAKNIILLIGDGMGLSQLSSAYYYSESVPNFSRFKTIGLHQPMPIGNKITDSASGATAFSTGYKSYNAAIGVDKDTVARETILEWAAKKSKSTGVISTSTITHATPASFYAHAPSRNLHEEIAMDFVKASIDFTAGGGYKYFKDRTDGKNLLDSLKAKGVVVNLENLPSAKELHPGTKYTYLLDQDSLHSKEGGRGDFLPRATNLALDFLSKDKDGFFLMVESSQIDWGGHSNKGSFLIKEVIDFDLTIGAALDFAEKDGNTLVLVTADHETGGFALSSAKVFGKDNYGSIQPTFSTGGHTAALIPVFAYGPGSEQFNGIYQNNDIFKKMMAAYLR